VWWRSSGIERISFRGIEADNRAMNSVGQQKREGSTHRIQWIAAVLIAYIGGVQTVLLYYHSAQVSNSDPEVAMMAPPPSVGVNQPADKKYKLAYDQSYHKFDSNLKFYEEPARWYMNNFEPDFTCAQERRVGGVGDGPKW
jgi:hypothetical protein